MDRGGPSNGGSSYYAVLGIRSDASFSDVRTAYRKLALKWHPDRCTQKPNVAGEAKRRFQQIQEAYSVLSDKSKRSMYDAGLYNPLEEDDDDFCDFMQEMISMMNNVKDEPQGETLEDLKRLFLDMVGGDGTSFDLKDNPKAAKKPRASSAKSGSTSAKFKCNVSRC